MIGGDGINDESNKTAPAPPPYHEYPQHNANAIPPFLRLVYLGNSPLKRK